MEGDKEATVGAPEPLHAAALSLGPGSDAPLKLDAHRLLDPLGGHGGASASIREDALVPWDRIYVHGGVDGLFTDSQNYPNI